MTKPILEEILKEGFVCMSKQKYGTFFTYAKGDERILYNSNRDTIDLRYKINTGRN